MRKYTSEYRAEAAKLANKIGHKKAALELGIPEGTISFWVSKAKRGEIDIGLGQQTPGSAMSQAAEIQKKLRQDIKELEKRNKSLERDNKFLEDAAAFFAASRQKYAKNNGSNI